MSRFPFLVLVGLIVVHFVSTASLLNAQSQPTLASVRAEHYLEMPSAQTPPQSNASGTGLNIVPTFDASVDAGTRTVINNVIAFYENTFTNNITVNIEFHSMNSGLGQSAYVCYFVPYTSYRAALGANATSIDDTTAIANTPSGSVNPMNGNANLCVKPSNGRALGLNTPDASLNFSGSPCPAFTGSGCIGLNVALANANGDLTAVIEHEIDEVLGLGSALFGTSTTARPYPQDLFRWGGPGVRSYAANTSTSLPCAGPRAFFSIDGGVTNLNEFNNCNNGGDYGDWITHTPSQVQDAFTNFSGSPSLTITSPEVRALDVIGYTVLNAQPPSAVSVTPSSGTGASQTFSFLFSDPNGAADLNFTIMGLIGPSGVVNGCVALYLSASNQLLLLNDAASAWLGPGTPGTAGTLQNSQCSVNLPTSSATPSGTNLTLNLALSFTSAFFGMKNILMDAQDNGGLTSGFQAAGTWTVVPAVNHAPTTVSVTPSSGSGASQTFSFKYADPDGATDLNFTIMGLIGPTGVVSGCVAIYVEGPNQLLLLNDAGTAWLGPATLGTAGTLQNSQCSVNLPTSSAIPSGTNLTVNLALSFTPAFSGGKTILMDAQDNTGSSSGFQAPGTWTAP